MVLCYHPYLVSMLFADLLSLHLVTFLMFFILVDMRSMQFHMLCIIFHESDSWYGVTDQHSPPPTVWGTHVSMIKKSSLMHTLTQ